MIVNGISGCFSINIRTKFGIETEATSKYKMTEVTIFSLFYHSGRNIETTVYAEEFYPYAVKTLDTLEEGIKLLSSVNEKIVTSVILYLEVASVSILLFLAFFIIAEID